MKFVFGYAEKMGFREVDRGFLDDFYTFSKAYFEVMFPRPLISTAKYNKTPVEYINEHVEWIQKRSSYSIRMGLDFIEYIHSYRSGGNGTYGCCKNGSAVCDP
jgi:hypothetical protein